MTETFWVTDKETGMQMAIRPPDPEKFVAYAKRRIRQDNLKNILLTVALLALAPLIAYVANEISSLMSDYSLSSSVRQILGKSLQSPPPTRSLIDKSHRQSVVAQSFVYYSNIALKIEKAEVAFDSKSLWSRYGMKYVNPIDTSLHVVMMRSDNLLNAHKDVPIDDAAWQQWVQRCDECDSLLHNSL